jgi:hypothetical protein
MPSSRSAGRPVAGSVLAGAACLALVLSGAACRGRADSGFAPDRASKHVRMLGSAFGSRPTGSGADRRARDYIVAELTQSGFEVRLQEAMAEAPGGLTVPVVNIIATRAGRQKDAIALVSHHDSRPESRGAADDGLGVAVCLEAGRVLAARPAPRYSLLVAITDAEELGLMGARALVGTPEYGAVRAFLNFEAVGTSGPARLFQAGPGNGWLAAAWARSAPFPAGSSLLTEIYRHLPNGTDFTILGDGSGRGVPGLDFAPTGNTFAYHTRLDEPSHLDPAAIAGLGENTVRLVEELETVDIGSRTADAATYFDAAGLTAFAYSSTATLVVAVLAFVLGLVAAYKSFLAAHDEVGTARVVITGAWGLLALAVMFGAMWIGCVLLRAGSGLAEPWYGQAGLFLLFLVTIGLAAVWVVVNVSRGLPVMFGPAGLPACVWMLALPPWIVILAVAQRLAPGVGYLVAWPLLVASALVIALPMRRAAAGRLVAAVTGVVAGLLWAPLVWPTFEFTVGLFGSLPTAAPSWFFPALLTAAALTMGPCAAAIVLGRRSRRLPASVTGSMVLLAVVAVSWILAVEPAYTPDRPERRTIRFIEDLARRQAWWEAGTHERDQAPAGDREGAPRGWEPIASPTPGPRISRTTGVFTYRAPASGLVAPPVEVRCSVEPAPGTDDVYVDTAAKPGLEGTGAAFVLPAGVVPAESSLKGVVRDGRWQAMVTPLPEAGLTLRVRVGRAALAKWSEARVLAAVHGVPGGIGWQRLPAWLPQEVFVWSPRSEFTIPWPIPEAPPVTPPATPGPPE